MFPRFAKIITFVFLLLSAAQQFSAQQYSFINYSIKDGLAQSQVQTIFQDDKGYLWLGTFGGLTRYDGKSFVNYSKENGLLDNRINSIVQDKNKKIWVATAGGINCFDGKSFKSYPLKAELAKNQVTAMVSDAKGMLWLCTDGAGVCRFDGRKFDYFTMGDGLPNDYVRTACLDENGVVWFGTRKGICFYANNVFSRIDSAVAQPHNISQIIKGKNGELWFCTYGEGVFNYNKEKFTNYTEKDGLVLDWIRSATQDVNGNVWFASKSGVSKFNGNTFLNFDESNGLFYANINTVMQDVEGKIWFGTDGKGVLKFTGETFVSYTTHEGLSGDIVMSVIADAEKNLWFSTYGNGVCKMPANKKNGFEVYTTDNGLNNNIVWTSCLDRKGVVWFGTSEGVCKYERGRFFEVPEISEGKTVYSIVEDKKGRLWFGTTTGVSVFDGKEMLHFTSEEYNIGKNIKSIIEDNSGNIWFASSNGVYRYNGKEFSCFTTNQGLTDNNVVSLVLDKAGNLWIGTINGITFYDGKSFKGISIDEKYNSNYVNFMVMDARQHLWVGTNNGIFEADAVAFAAGKKSRFKQYTNFEGLRSLECNQNAAFMDPGGNLWFGTSEGVLKYTASASSTHNDSPEPFTHITGVRLFLQATDWSKYSESIDSISGLPKNLSVDYRNRNFTFDFIGISLSNPGSVLYKFMLEGFDQDWSPPTDATFATYSNLPHGKYTFKVMACNKNGDWNKVPASFSFEIRTPYWLTWWFFLLCMVFVVCLVWVLYFLRVSNLKRKHHTQQLEFKSKLLVLEHQTLNASMNRHFVFNALNSIQYYINKEDKISANKYLSSFAKLIRKNLDSSLRTFVPLSEEIERLKLYMELEQMRFEQKFSYFINVEGDVDTDSIEIPPMMLQPYIENSIWHGILPMEKPGVITISIKESGDNIMFSIEDNGIGIEASMEKKRQRGQTHISHGMEITRGRIHLLRTITNSELSVNGPYDVKNELNVVTGTRLEIVLPLKN